MFKFTTIAQLEKWVFDQAPVEATKKQILEFSDAIRRDPKRPEFTGDDWGTYLSGIRFKDMTKAG
jgi:hypothetical protein